MGAVCEALAQPACTLTSLTLIIVVSLQIFSVLNSDDASAPALDTQPQGDEEGELHSGWGVVGGRAGLGLGGTTGERPPLLCEHAHLS